MCATKQHVMDVEERRARVATEIDCKRNAECLVCVEYDIYSNARIEGKII